jgi:hypothetical protein
MKLIPLSKGKFAKVDDDKYDFAMQWKWPAIPGESKNRAKMRVLKNHSCVVKQRLRDTYGYKCREFHVRHRKYS